MVYTTNRQVVEKSVIIIFPGPLPLQSYKLDQGISIMHSWPQLTFQLRKAQVMSRVNCHIPLLLILKGHLACLLWSIFVFLTLNFLLIIVFLINMNITRLICCLIPSMCCQPSSPLFVCLLGKKPLRIQRNKTHINYRKKTTGNQKYNWLRDFCLTFSY